MPRSSHGRGSSPLSGPVPGLVVPPGYLAVATAARPQSRQRGSSVEERSEHGRGGSRRVARRSRDWVSKTDMTRYVRCPYAFWLLDTGQIDQADVIGELQRQRLLEG